MPRRTLSARKARAALMTLRLDSARRQALELRGAYRFFEKQPLYLI